VNYASPTRHLIDIYSYLFREMHYSISELIFFIKKFQPKHGKLIKYSEADKVYIVEICQANDLFIIYVFFGLFILFPTTFIFHVSFTQGLGMSAL